jgi:hypothetical protein
MMNSPWLGKKWMHESKTIKKNQTEVNFAFKPLKSVSQGCLLYQPFDYFRILGKAILFSTAGIRVCPCDGHLPQAVSDIARLGCRNLLELSFLLTLLIKYK